MALRNGHGTGAGVPRVEVLPADELPSPVAAPLAVAARPVERRPDGKLAGSEAARELGRRGGEAKARKVRLVDSLGLARIAGESSFAPYRTAAEEFVVHHVACLAQQAGGEVGPGPSTMVASAALQLAASRWAFDRGGEMGDADLLKLGSQLANDSRQNLLAAYELAVREGKARAQAGDAWSAEARRKADEAYEAKIAKEREQQAAEEAAEADESRATPAEGP
jgi:hypothetical protein